jgi:Zn-finger nucleic acid-binding protein/membrane associated rhomboid family serine protease
MAKVLPVKSSRFCPKCDARMRLMRVRQVEIDVCPRCLGSWYEVAELARASGNPVPDHPSTEALAGAHRTEFRCPMCATPMYELELVPGSGVLADVCLDCSGVFLDRNEFRCLREHFQRKARGGAAGVQLLGAGAHDALFRWLMQAPSGLSLFRARFPYVTVALLLILTATWFLGREAGAERVLEQWGLAPGEVIEGRRLHTLLTYMFAHVDGRVLVSVLLLCALGDVVERWLGSWKFLALYLGAGLAGGLLSAIECPTQNVPDVGAGFAMAAVLGAFVSLGLNGQLALPTAEREGLRHGIGALVAMPALYLWMFCALEAAEDAGPPPLLTGLGMFVVGVAVGAWHVWHDGRTTNRGDI